MKLLYPIILLLSAASPSHGLDASLTTGFAGTNQANGNIFTVKNKGGQSIAITSFDVNMSGPPAPSPAPTEVYFLPGIDPGYQDTQSYPYQKIFDGMVAGQGKGNVTPLPAFDTPVVIPAGATYSFYITTVGLQVGTYLWYNIGSAVGSIVASDDYLEVGEGWALGYPFLGYSDQRRWNGNVHYTVGAAPTGTPAPTVSTPPPTNAPTQSPVTSSPTPKPTPISPPDDTLDPTPSPTRSPVVPPTEPPVQNPTGPSQPDASDSPTKSPVSSPTGPTNGGGVGPPSTPEPTKAPISSPSQPTSSGTTPSSPSRSPSLRPTLSHEPSSFGPTVWKDNFLPNQPSRPTSSSFKATALQCFVPAALGVAAAASFFSF